MNRWTSLLPTALLALAALGAVPAEAVVITNEVQAPVEPCKVDLPRYFQAPPALLNCLDWNCLWACANNPLKCTGACNYPNCGRLIPSLRSAAQTRDAQEILIRAGLEYYVLRRPPGLVPITGSPLVAQALADLAVTGGAAYDSFRRFAPSEATLAELLRLRLLGTFGHVAVPADLIGAVQQTLHRAYQVAWALRGPTPYRNAHRDRLGWIAVSGEDDPPHRPVNVPSAPFPQYNMTVRVDAIDVVTRYMVASRHITDDHPVYVGTVPPDRDHPLVIGDVVLFIHGHSSSVEEAETLAGPLLAQAEARGRPVTLIAMDLPSNGYASMIEHTTVAPADASRWNSGYPILDFIEKFLVAFVEGLEARQPGIKGQIVGVIGGSLGGNMGLRLGRRDPALYPWLRNIVSWSPASSWDSWARAVLVAHERFYDVAKHEGVRQSRDRMNEVERTDGSPQDSLHKLFYDNVAGVIETGRVGQAEYWYSPSWPCREAAKTSGHRALYEIYNARFRRWHWRVAHEQLIYSHWDSEDAAVEPDPRYDAAAGPARYSQIRARLLLASGYDDDKPPVALFSNTKNLAQAMTMVNGSAIFVKDTGHSIHIEKPAFFAGQILDFLFASPAPPFPAFLVPATSF